MREELGLLLHMKLLKQIQRVHFKRNDQLGVKWRLSGGKSRHKCRAADLSPFGLALTYVQLAGFVVFVGLGLQGYTGREDSHFVFFWWLGNKFWLFRIHLRNHLHGKRKHGIAVDLFSSIVQLTGALARHLVILKHVLAVEAEPALLAHEGADVEVAAQVVHHIALRAEVLPAVLRTRKWPLTRVNQHVRAQVLLLAEALHAAREATFERLSAHVHVHVGAEAV